MILLSLLKGGTLRAQFSDTILSSIISKPFFYNIIKGGHNRVFAGTSEGIFEIKGTTISHYDSRKGYITLDKEEKPIIDKNGIKFNRTKTYSYLLPYPELDKERSYHVGLEKLFYLCSGGRLIIFDILPYKIDYINHSIRSISKDLVGTYSGIYLKGKKIGEPMPPYTDGYVRQIDDRGFVCGYPFTVLEKDAMETGVLRPDTNCFKYVEPDGLMISDLVAARDGQSYYIATLDKLILADYSFKKDTVLYRKKDKSLPVVLAAGHPEKLYFTAGPELLTVSYRDYKTSSVLKVKDPIHGAVFFGYHIYFITENALYRYNSSNKLEKLADLEDAHTLGLVLGDQLLIGSNLGLFHYSMASNQLSVVIKNVEFNKGAMYSDFDPKKEIDNISVGSINGLYTFRLSDIPEMIAGNKQTTEKSNPTSLAILALGVFSLLLLLLLVFVVRRNRIKLRSAEKFIEELQTPQKEVTREDVNDFIKANLSNASIKTLTDEFGLNAPQLYNILKPERPGSIIQRLRLEKVKEMRENNQSVKEIAVATGLSETYVKKIKT